MRFSDVCLGGAIKRFEMRLDQYLLETTSVIESLADRSDEIQMVIERCVSAVSAGRKIIFCGNGGSAGDAQHLSAELMGRFLFDRRPIASISLTVDTSALTAIGNDYGFDQVFSRQLLGLGKQGDVLIGLSTSGNSLNVVTAFEVARTMGITTVGFTGSLQSKMDQLSDILVKVNSSTTHLIQEAQFVVGHYICLKVEQAFS